MCLDSCGDRAVESGDALRGLAVESTEDDDAGEVELVAVVEDEIVPKGVVAQVAYVGARSVGLPRQGER